MFNFLHKDKSIDLICRRIVEVADEAIIAFDQYGYIILFNKGAEKIFDHMAEEIMGKHIDMIIPEKNELMQSIASAEITEDGGFLEGFHEKIKNLSGVKKDGTEIITESSISRIEYDEEHTAYSLMLRDVSEEKKNEEELLRLASTDPLTGAFNRREFTALSSREAKRASRYGRPLSIMMLDLDHFKELNDNYGHAAGDKALQRFTTICCNALRNVDVFGRWGGEEFVAMLPETNAEAAAVIAERLRYLVSETEIEFNGEKIRFTVSIGIAVYQETETVLDGPLGRADAAVYDAKKAGRNKIAIYKD